MRKRTFLFTTVALVLFGASISGSAHACTTTPSPTPTATPDANGYIPPTPTQRPTRTPVPVPTRVSQLATQSAVIAEGSVRDGEQYATPRYYEGGGTAVFDVEHYYQGNGGDSLAFSYYVVPCPGAVPRFANTLQGVYFFREDIEGQLTFHGYMPADGETQRSLAIAVGPGRQPRAVFLWALPLIAVVVAASAALWRWVLRR